MMESEPFIFTTPYAKYSVVATGGYYADGQRRIQLVDTADGCPVATATVNLPGTALADDAVLIKSWSENEGVLEALVWAGIVEYPTRSVPTGHGHAHALVCKLTDTGKQLWEPRPKTSE